MEQTVSMILHLRIGIEYATNHHQQYMDLPQTITMTTLQRLLLGWFFERRQTQDRAKVRLNHQRHYKMWGIYDSPKYIKPAEDSTQVVPCQTPQKASTFTFCIDCLIVKSTILYFTLVWRKEHLSHKLCVMGTLSENVSQNGESWIWQMMQQNVEKQKKVQRDWRFKENWCEIWLWTLWVQGKNKATPRNTHTRFSWGGEVSLWSLQLQSDKNRERQAAQKVSPWGLIFRCKECDFKSVYVSGLKYHTQSVHFRERPFKCNPCDRAFFRPRDLRFEAACDESKKYLGIVSFNIQPYLWPEKQ